MMIKTRTTVLKYTYRRSLTLPFFFYNYLLYEKVVMLLLYITHIYVYSLAHIHSENCVKDYIFFYQTYTLFYC